MGIPILGSIIDKVINKGGDIIKELVPDKDLAKRLDHEFRTQLARGSQAMEQLYLQAESDMFKAQQETIQAELHQTDLYTKRTRPKIARQSWYITMMYAMGIGFSNALPVAWGIGEVNFSWEIFAVLSAPALTYMGVRGIEQTVRKLNHAN